MNRGPLLGLLLFIAMPPSWARDEVLLWHRNFIKPAIYDVIELAMELSEDEFGAYSIKPSLPMEQGRAFAELASGSLHVAVAGINPEREMLADTIYVPIDRGLLGLRVCMTTADKQADFAQVNTLGDIHRLRLVIGLGQHWPDREIIEANGLRTMNSPVYESLFDMLLEQRFDCFLRSLNEVDFELAAKANAQLVVEPHIALVYPLADFIFVSKQQPRIKARLQQGLQRALENGDFYRLFEQHFLNSMKKHQFYQRKLLFLTNPNLSAQARDAINQMGIISFAPSTNADVSGQALRPQKSRHGVGFIGE